MSRWVVWHYSFCYLLGCITSKKQIMHSQEQICSDNFTYCHTKIEAADCLFVCLFVSLICYLTSPFTR